MIIIPKADEDNYWIHQLSQGHVRVYPPGYFVIGEEWKLTEFTPTYNTIGELGTNIWKENFSAIEFLLNDMKYRYGEEFELEDRYKMLIFDKKTEEYTTYQADAATIYETTWWDDGNKDGYLIYPPENRPYWVIYLEEAALGKMEELGRFESLADVRDHFKTVYGQTIMLKDLPEQFKNAERSKLKKPRKEYRLVGTFPSTSDPNKTYTVKVDLETKEYTCDCKGWIFNARKDRTCKHTDLLVGNKRSRAQDVIKQGLTPAKVLDTIIDNKPLPPSGKKKRRIRLN